jgi:hypothetical protein
MKQSNKILMLTIIVASIVVFWLVPGINKSNATKYTRVFENTDVKKSANYADTLKTKRTKVFRKESIKADAKLKDIKPKMFSRAIHFSEEKMVLDSSADFTSADSTGHLYDSLTRL